MKGTPFVHLSFHGLKHLKDWFCTALKDWVRLAPLMLLFDLNREIKGALMSAEAWRDLQL